MKNYIVILGLISFLNFQIHGDDLPQVKDSSEKKSENSITSDDEDKEPTFNVFAYANVGLGIGIGVCGRSRSNHFGIEYNIAITTTTISFINMASVSLLFYTKLNKRSLYFGGGLGGYIINDSNFKYMAPIFLGYEWKSCFIDLGALIPFEKYQCIPLPNLRVGFRF